eukprot:764046-Hanusia_phi.AAC.17
MQCNAVVQRMALSLAQDYIKQVLQLFVPPQPLLPCCSPTSPSAHLLLSFSCSHLQAPDGRNRSQKIVTVHFGCEPDDFRCHFPWSLPPPLLLLFLLLFLLLLLLLHFHFLLLLLHLHFLLLLLHFLPLLFLHLLKLLSSLNLLRWLTWPSLPGEEADGVAAGRRMAGASSHCRALGVSPAVLRQVRGAEERERAGERREGR